MKKIFTFIFAIALSLNMLGQCPLTTAVDFTATDCHGTEVHLFDILDGGQYVLMDFFFTTCGPCQQATPKVVESYYAFGCNMYDVFYIEVSVSDGDAACQTWANTYGVEYPTISTAGGGATICNSLYQIGQYPTVILIAPDRSILIQDLWPINNAQTIINALTPYGIQQHDCTAPAGEVVFNVDVIEMNMGGCIEEPGKFTIYNETTVDVVIEDYMASQYNFLCLDSDDLGLGNDIKGMTIASSDSLDVYVHFLGIRDYEMNDTLKLVTSFGEYELPVLMTVHEGVGEVGANNFTLYPNPVNDFLKINGENLGNISVYNALGQKVAEFVAGDELNIATSDFENGVYFVKIGDKTQRFVVTH